MAAALACGDGALLSHWDAAALWDLRRAGSGKIHVTTGRSVAGHPGLSVHHVRAIHPDDRAVVDGIPVTSVAKTLLDMAAILRPDALERLVEQVELRKLFDLEPIDQLIARSRGRRGSGKLMSVIADLRPYVPMTRSELEREFVRICREAGLPEPSMNVWVGAYEVDALFRDHAIVVELDGGEYHGTTAARRRDPIRDARLQAAGYRLVRVHERWLHDAPQAIRALLRTSRRSA
jgi:very-short-patch-repair endonuclease